MQCVKPFRLIYKGMDMEKYPQGYMEVPCGKCVACRIARCREWAMRLVHELDDWGDACFICLTYANEHLPKGGTLVKKDLQNFFKRLRKNMLGFKLKYYASGEYGEENFRPHYHAIIYGLGPHHHLCDSDGIILDGPITDAWKFGSVHMGTVTYESCRYVAQYLETKYDGELGNQVYTSKGLQIPFRLSSQGFGLNFALDNADAMKSDLYTTIHGVKVGLPRYYRSKLGLTGDYFIQGALDKKEESIIAHLRNGGDWADYSQSKQRAREQSLATLEARVRIGRLRNRS